MQGLACNAVTYLMTATGAVGDKYGIHASGAYLRQQREFCHLHGGVVMLGLHAKGASHAATTGLNEFNLQLRHQPEYLAHGLHRAEGFLVAMAMYQRLACYRFKWQIQSLSIVLTCNELFQQ